MPVTLPQEIIDAIIDDVALIQNVEPLAPFSAGNAASSELSACASTSSMFLPRARRHIFRQILLFPHEDLQRIAPFSFNPGRPRKVRKLSISSRFIERVQPSTAALVESLVLIGSFGPGGTDLEEWASMDPDFRRVVVSLTSLQSITLRRFMIYSLSANTLHSIFPNLVIRSIILAGVHMQNGAMPPFFLLFPHIESLEIVPAPAHDSSWANTVFWIPQPGARTPQASLLPRPQSLTLMGIDGGELSRLVDHPWPLQLNHIHCLKCSFSWYGTQQLASLDALMSNMSALAHLSLGFQDTDHTIDRRISKLLFVQILLSIMAAPPQQLSLDVATTAIDLQNASDSLAPQWAIDMENRLTHCLEWNLRVQGIHRHNLEVAQREQSEWNHARFLNKSCKHDGELLTPLPLPLPRIDVVIPPAPAPGAVANHPPPWAPPAIVVPAADPTFPATKGPLRVMSAQALDDLLQTYNLPGVNVGTVEDRRGIFARHIGVSL